MATSKFKRMLNKELSHFSESKSGSQISEFILRTYVDKQEEVDLPFLKTTDDASSGGPAIGGIPSGSSTTAGGVAVTTGSTNLTCTSVKVTAVQTSGGSGTTVVANTGSTSGPSMSSAAASSAAAALAASTAKSKMGATRTMGTIAGVKKPILQHSNSLTRLPKYGVEVTPGAENEEKLGKLLSNISRWGVDIFMIADLTCNRPLTTVMYAIFKQRDLLNSFQISATTFLSCMLTLEEHYQHVPYHNSMHAADVAQSVHVLLMSPALEVIQRCNSRIFILISLN